MEWTVSDESETPVQEFYANRSVLVTGATGFIGKILVEKLLRCLPAIKSVYLLIRPKKGKSPKERLEVLLEKECFGPLKEKLPTFKDKIVLVVGDVAEFQCGISDDDVERLREEVSIVFHSAARVQFLDPLRTAIQENLIGSRNVLELCKRLPLLEAFIHMSTAFARREPDGVVPEEVGGSHVRPNEIITLLKILDDESLKKITPSIVKDNGTTYQFSKALTELLLEEEKGNLPVGIVRPCVVCSSWKEPLPGWCDIYQGMTGLFVAGSKGFFRTTYAPLGYRILAVPADVVVNCTIAAGWYTATTRPENILVVNCGMKYEDFPVGEDLLGHVLKLRDICPLTSIYRYPDFAVYQNKWLHKIHATVDHYIPAAIIDALLFIFTGKTLMLRLYRRMDVLMDIFVTQGSLPWYFDYENYNKIKNSLSTKDAEIFFMDMDTLDWTDYLTDCALGGRKFLVKEDPSTIPYALKKSKIWWLVTTILKWCFILFLIYYLMPQSFTDYATTHFQSYQYTSKPTFAVSSDEINFDDKLNPHTKI